MVRYLALTAAFAAALLALARAQVTCDQRLDSPAVVTSDVQVAAGTVCIVDGVNITGSIHVQQGATLTTSGTTFVFGVIRGTQCGSLFLGGQLSVGGGVHAEGCQLVDVMNNANVGSLMTKDVSSVMFGGTAALLSVMGTDAALFVNGGRVLGGGVLRADSGTTKFCGATVLGGVKIERSGDLTSLAQTGCEPSDISGTIEVIESKANVQVGGGMLLGADLIVSNTEGNVLVQNTHLSDVSIGRVTGSVTLDGVVADSDAGITGISGPLMITRSSFDGDTLFTGNPGAVTIDNNDFTLEDLLISMNGPVTITNNGNFSFSAVENQAVTVNGNSGITVLSITKTLGPVNINNNSIETANCADNAQLPTGSGNSIIIDNSAGNCGDIV